MHAIFVSYSHRDEDWKERVMLQLRVVAREFGIDVWDDRRIESGQDWRSQIETALAAARVALLLVSANSLTSDFILDEEIPPLLHRRAGEGLRLIPVILKPCPWQEVRWLSPIQVFPRDGVPLSTLGESEVDTALAELARDVARSVSPDMSTTAGARVTAPPRAPIAAPTAGADALAEYESLTQIHEGPYSRVWKACRDGRQCVVKETTAPVSRLALDTVLALDCPNLAAPTRIWEDGGKLYEELPYIDGVLLSEIVRTAQGPIEGALLESLHQQLDRTLELLHRARVVHRDVNPDNVFLVVRSADEVSEPAPPWAFDMFGQALTMMPARFPVGEAFGAAWVLGDPTFAVLSTERDQVPCRHGPYTAAEQEAGAAIPASDMYSLGATLYYAIAAQPPPRPPAPGQPPIEVPPASLKSYDLDGLVSELLSSDLRKRPAAGKYSSRSSSILDEPYGVLPIGSDAYVAMREFPVTTLLLRGQAALREYQQ